MDESSFEAFEVRWSVPLIIALGVYAGLMLCGLVIGLATPLVKRNKAKFRVVPFRLKPHLIWSVRAALMCALSLNMGWILVRLFKTSAEPQNAMQLLLAPLPSADGYPFQSPPIIICPYGETTFLNASVRAADARSEVSSVSVPTMEHMLNWTTPGEPWNFEHVPGHIAMTAIKHIMQSADVLAVQFGVSRDAVCALVPPRLFVWNDTPRGENRFKLLHVVLEVDMTSVVAAPPAVFAIANTLVSCTEPCLDGPLDYQSPGQMKVYEANWAPFGSSSVTFQWQTHQHKTRSYTTMKYPVVAASLVSPNATHVELIIKPQDRAVRYLVSDGDTSGKLLHCLKPEYPDGLFGLFEEELI
eukprot:gene3863-4247_t